MTDRLVGALHVEAMVLADEVRAYFDEAGRGDRDALPPPLRVAFSCESLKVTTRLMHVTAWLMARRGGGWAGRPLADVDASEARTVATMPASARALIEASCDLYARVQRLEADVAAPMPPPSPALGLIHRLERAF